MIERAGVQPHARGPQGPGVAHRAREEVLAEALTDRVREEAEVGDLDGPILGHAAQLVPARERPAAPRDVQRDLGLCEVGADILVGPVPPLALHLASYTVLGLFCLFAGALNLIDPVKIPHGLMFLAVCGFSWGYVFGILMARREVVILGFLASAAWLVAAAVGTARFGFDWRLTALLAALGASGLIVLALYRTRILEH